METQRAFPILESLSLRSWDGNQPKFQDKFFRGPDLSDLLLRRFRLENISLNSLACISKFLMSATALTDLYLRLRLDDTALNPPAETSILACLQGMTCLRRFDLSIPRGRESPSQPSTLKVIVSKLTCFRYACPCLFLDGLVAGLSAPSLER